METDNRLLKTEAPCTGIDNRVSPLIKLRELILREKNNRSKRYKTACKVVSRLNCRSLFSFKRESCWKTGPVSALSYYSKR